MSHVSVLTYLLVKSYLFSSDMFSSPQVWGGGAGQVDPCDAKFKRKVLVNKAKITVWYCLLHKKYLKFHFDI